MDDRRNRRDQPGPDHPSPAPSTTTAATRAALGPSFLKVAVVASLLSFVVGAILAHGLYFAVIHYVQQLTTETARATVRGLTPAERQEIAQQTVDTAITAYPLLRRDRVTVSVTHAANDPSIYHVTLRYDASHIGIWSLADYVPLPSSQIQHSSTIRRGGY
jgi:Flp pilus assembly protein TadG